MVTTDVINISTTEDTDETITVTLTDSDGSAYNMSSSTVNIVVVSLSDRNTALHTISATGASSGFSFDVTSTHTATPGEYYYRCEETRSGNDVIPCKGVFRVNRK